MWDINYMSSIDPECRAQDPSSKCNLNPCLQTLLVIAQEFLCNHPVLCKDKESILAHIYISVQAVDIPWMLKYILKSQKLFLCCSSPQSLFIFCFCFLISMEPSVTVMATIGFRILTLCMSRKGEMDPRLRASFIGWDP